MEPFNVTTFLHHTLRVDPTGRIPVQELYGRYEQVCNENGITCLKKEHFGKLLCKLFPDIRKINSTDSKTRKSLTVYLGISFLPKPRTEPNGCKLTLTELSAIATPCFVISVSNEKLELAMQSDIIANGNIVLKYITFNQSSWALKVRGLNIDLHTMGVSVAFNQTDVSFKMIIDIVSKFQICHGCQLLHDVKTIPKLAKKEFLSVKGDENSENIRYRSQHCTEVVTWEQLGKTCRKCYMNFSAVKRDLAVNNDNDSIALNNNDHKDLSEILSHVFPNASDEMKEFLSCQQQALLCKTPTNHRWNKNVIKACLGLWIRSPSAYQDLSDTNMFILPSGRQLRRYKNCIPQSTGINMDMLRWMSASAKQVNLPKEGYFGGIIHDETKIQQDIIWQGSGEKSTIIGFVDTGSEGLDLKILKEAAVRQSVATEVLQITFVGYTGFRFPVAHFPTAGVKASELYTICWDLISQLQDWGFQVDYILQDGGEQNREFSKLHFNDPVKSNYSTPSFCNFERNIVISQDYSHAVKKIRNAVLSSGQGRTRSLKLHNGDKYLPITWALFVDAVNWDRRSNTRLIHQRITDTHISPNNSEKMRNHLAEQMMDKDMLNLMNAYKGSLEDGSILDGCVALLSNTSELIEIFHDHRPIKSMEDERLQKLKRINDWFTSWRSHINGDESYSAGERRKMLPSWECLDDLQCLLLAFNEICRIHLSDGPCYSVKPYLFNSDIIENHFCQIRGLHNGNKTHPTYYDYKQTVNSIILNQSSKSRGRKSNAGLKSADPYNFSIPAKVIRL